MGNPHFRLFLGYFRDWKCLFLCSAFKRLLQYMQLLVQLGHLKSFAANFSHGVQNSGVVTPSEKLTNFRQAFLGQLFGEIHGNLAWPCNACRTLFRVHVCDFNFVIVGHSFLDVLHRDLSVLNRQKVS